MPISLTYYIYIIPGLLLGLIAQFWISSATKKYSRVQSGSGITGLEAAQRIVQQEGFPVEIRVGGKALTDNFDPIHNIVNLSVIATSDSVTSVAIAAHEFGHVQQKFSNSALFTLRSGIVPIVNWGSRLGMVLIIGGLILNMLGLAQLGLVLFALTTVFSLVTLPLEIDASRRGIEMIRKYNLLTDSNMVGAKSVLNAAALTYVAALLTSMLNLLYYASLVSGNSRD